LPASGPAAQALARPTVGIGIPIVLVRAPGQPVPLAGGDRMLHVTDAAEADQLVAEIEQPARVARGG
jgi:hypothetical protein